MSTETATTTVEFFTSGPTSRGSDTRLLLNGQNITKYSRKVDISADCNDCTEVAITLLARDGFDIRLQADVTLNVTALPGYMLIEEVTDDGKRWRVEREVKA